jgi:uncharacterized membrane protein
MKGLFTGLVMLSLTAFVGCSSSNSGTSNKVGGPGATQEGTDRKGSILGPKEGEFSLSPPTFAKKIKQGASDVVTIEIKRGKNFDEDVALSFDGVPDHVSLDPKLAAIKKGEENAKITVKVGEGAGLGDHTITVTGKPTKGEPASAKFTLTVEAK